MIGSTGNWHEARRRHLRICREDAWGVPPESPLWHAVPAFGDGFTLKAANPHFSPDNEFGGDRRVIALSHVRRVSGSLYALPWPEVTGLLLEMALERIAGDLHSYCMDYYTPADPRRCLGVMVDLLELTARPARWDLVLRLGLKARAEEANPSLSEGDFDYAGVSPVPFRFERASVSLDGTPVSDVESFTLRVRNNIVEGPSRGGAVAFLIPSQRDVQLELTTLDDGAALNEAIRDDGTISFSATLLHPAGHALALALPALHPQTNLEQARPGELARSLVRVDASTDAHGNDVTYELNLMAPHE